MKQLNNLITLVTGAGQGLGKSIALCLAEAGAVVIVSDINEKRAREVSEEINKNGGRSKHMLMDVGDQDSISKTIDEIIAANSRLDIVINNAAIDVTKPIHDLTTKQIMQIVRINLLGPFLVSKCALKEMYKRNSGHIVNISSTGGKRAWPNASAYNASKWGLIGLSRALYTEARQHNIRISAVIPGGMKTPFILERFPDTPREKLQDPEVVAETVKFVLQIPEDSIIPEIMILPLQETSWP